MNREQESQMILSAGMDSTVKLQKLPSGMSNIVQRSDVYDFH